jgi:hypothetical protein
MERIIVTFGPKLAEEIMDDIFFDAVKSAAYDLSNINCPNSDDYIELYNRGKYFGSKVLNICETRGEKFSDEIDGALFEIGNFEIRVEDIDRESLVIVYKITTLKNAMYAFVNEYIRSKEAESGGYQVTKEEIKDLVDSVDRLNSYIEQERTFSRNESKVLRAAGYAQLNMLFFSIPMQSVFDLISAAKSELEKYDSANIRYVSTLLSNASTIANTFWKEVKTTVSEIPKRFEDFAVNLNNQVSSAASKSLNFLIKTRIRRIKPQSTAFEREADAHKLSTKRDILISYVEDFKKWTPKSAPQVFSSALYILITDRSYYPHSREIVTEISRDIVFLQSETVEVVKSYMISKSEILISNLSDNIRSIESELKN